MVLWYDRARGVVRRERREVDLRMAAGLSSVDIVQVDEAHDAMQSLLFIEMQRSRRAGIVLVP